MISADILFIELSPAIKFLSQNLISSFIKIPFKPETEIAESEKDKALLVNFLNIGSSANGDEGEWGV